MTRLRTTARGRPLGQSLAEFALVLPVLLLIALLGLDLGRAFFSWVTLTNAARVAANYAGLNPNASFAEGSTYDSLLRADATNAACVVTAGAPPQPVFTDSALDANMTSRDLGDSVTVTISCPFRPITPIVSAVTGSPFMITASAAFTIRYGAFNP